MNERESEELEFMQAAGGGPEGEIPLSPKRRRDLDDEPGEEAQLDGLPCQYALNGPGFVPASKTVPKLRPAAYEIKVISDILTFCPREIVTDELLRLPDSRSDEVVAEIERFWTLKERYKRFGFSHKRGFLLWGPPGSGKTSTVAIVLRQMVDAGGVVLIVNNINPGVVSNMLSQFRQVEPGRHIVVVLEDIDAIIEQHGESDFLSLLDGETSIDDVVFLATTNYPEKLDGRVLNRPSRFDRVVKIGMPVAAARLKYLESRQLGLPAEELERWVEATEGFSLAHIKEMVVSVMCFGDDIESVAKRLKHMARRPKSDDQEGPVGFGARDYDD